MNLDCRGNLVEFVEGEAASALEGSAQCRVTDAGFVREGPDADVFYDEGVGYAGGDL